MEIRPASPAASELVAQLDADLQSRYPGGPIYGISRCFGKQLT